MEIIKTWILSKGNRRYLCTHSSYSICSSCPLSKSLSRPFLRNPICMKSLRSISSFCSERRPLPQSACLSDCHGYRRLSSFSTNGSYSVCSITCPCSQSSKCLGFRKFGCWYDGFASQSPNRSLFSYLGHVSLSFCSVSSSHAARYKKPQTYGGSGVRQKATRKQVSVIIDLLITEDDGLKSKLNSLSVELSTGSVNRVFYVLNRNKKSALQFFHWIRRWQPELEHNSDICSLIIDNCGHLGDYNAMRSLLKEFNWEKLVITKKSFEYIRAVAANKKLLNRVTCDVVDILQEVGGTSCGNGVVSLIEMLSDCCCFDMAKFVIEKTKSKLSYYNILVRELCRRCDFEAAINLMDEMRKRECNPSTQTYNHIISSLLKNGKNANACELFQEMTDKGCPPDALTFEIFVYNSCSEGKFDNAFKFFDDMVERGLKPRLLTHAAFIKGYFNSKQYDKAYKYVVDSDDKYSRNVNYSLLADLYQKSGNLVDAEKVLWEMINKGLKPHYSTYMRVKLQLLKMGNEKLATDLEKKFCQLECRA